MNPLFLLLGLFGTGALTGALSSSSPTISQRSSAEDHEDEATDRELDRSDDDASPSNQLGHSTTGDASQGDQSTDEGAMHDASHDDHSADDSTSEHTTTGDASQDDHGMDHDTGGSAGQTPHGSHEEHEEAPAIAPPGVGASQAEIRNFLQDLAAMPEAHAHADNASLIGEHTAVLDLVERGEATHVAISNGDWTDPSIWAGGEVPGDDAKVLIPDGVTVDYGDVSDARLFTVRVDGTLDFATNTDSQMIFDTFIVAPTGHLIIGTENNPVDPDVNVDLIVANNGRIDTNWDPQLLSRGLVSHGETSIYGAEKDSHDKVSTDPQKGDTSVKFNGVPDGWQVGDTIVIAGTTYEGWSGNGQNYTPPEDEVRVISQIDNNGRVHFEDALVHDHSSPRADLKTSVANYTRNVSVETENADSAEIYERGHVMLAHSDDIEVHHAEFSGLGRTDKSIEAKNVSDFNNVKYDTNVQGRYSLHIHRAGVDNLEDPAILEGNAIFGSPGWGVVHHDSNAILTNNATYDTFGAGFVAETGNETGQWVDNIAINAKGVSWGIPKNTSEIKDTFDTARGGEGFWFQGRLVEATDNVAASVNVGFAYFHRDKADGTLDFDAELFDFPQALAYDDVVRADDVSIRVFDGNETFASNEGLHVVKANTAQGHDVWSHLTDFTAWNVQTGAHLQYTSHYILEDFDLVGAEGAKWGIRFGNNLSEITVVEPSIDGFNIGIDLNKDFRAPGVGPDRHDYVIVDPTFRDVNNNYDNFDARLDTITTSRQLDDVTPELSLDRLEYSNSNGRTVYITGEKTDSLGTTDFPGGLDEFKINRAGVENILEQEGYWTTSNGETYVLLDIFTTDRTSGELFYETHPVYIEDLPLRNFENNGQQNITTRNGVTRAGNEVLDRAFEAEPDGGFVVAQENAAEASLTLSSFPGTAHQDHSVMALTEEDTADADWALNDDADWFAEDDVMNAMTSLASDEMTHVHAASEPTDSTHETTVSHTHAEPTHEPEADMAAMEDYEAVLWDVLTENQPVMSETMSHEHEEDALMIA